MLPVSVKVAVSQPAACRRSGRVGTSRERLKRALLTDLTFQIPWASGPDP